MSRRNNSGQTAAEKPEFNDQRSVLFPLTGLSNFLFGVVSYEGSRVFCIPLQNTKQSESEVDTYPHISQHISITFLLFGRSSTKTLFQFFTILIYLPKKMKFGHQKSYIQMQKSSRSSPPSEKGEKCFNTNSNTNIPLILKYCRKKVLSSQATFPFFSNTANIL